MQEAKWQDVLSNRARDRAHERVRCAAVSSADAAEAACSGEAEVCSAAADARIGGETAGGFPGSYDPAILQDPTIYRIYEAVIHNGESFKEIINEELGDGIMSAIGFYASVDKIKGSEGEDRVVITFNGKFLPYTEQVSSSNTATVAKSLNNVRL